ncbi:MAG: hypothetical protein R3C27_12180 [Hyphomonadaceae bacterium]
MNANNPAKPERPTTANAARQLVQFIRACKASVESIATDDHATMNEIEQALAAAEVAAQRLLSDIQRTAGDKPDGIVDLDDF